MDNKKANKEFDLPAYINIPFFLYQDERLDKTATLLAGFFYSLHTANKDIFSSTDYLCFLVKVKKRNIYKILNQLEELKYISRSGSTNRRNIHWVYEASANIIISDSNQTSAPQDTSLQTSALQDTKLVHCSAPNSCTAVHTYIKEDTKDITTTTVVAAIDQKTPKKPTPKTPLSVVISIQADHRLLTAYRSTPIDSPYFLTETDFLMCCKWSIDNRDEGIHENGRIKSIIGFIRKGAFEIPNGWIKTRGKINKNQEAQVRAQAQVQVQEAASLKKYEQDMMEYKSRPKKDTTEIPSLEIKINSASPFRRGTPANLSGDSVL